MRNALLVAGLLVTLASAGCAMIYDVEGPHWRDYKPSKTLGPAFAAPGSEWSYVRRDSGSFGSGVSHVSSKSLPMQNWVGRPHFAYQGAEATLLLEPTTGRWAASAKDGKPLVTFDPPIGYHWPMWVGETWSTPYKITNHATNRTTEVRVTFTVEALETVNVPAGTYRAYRVFSSDPVQSRMAWYSADLGLWVKSRLERKSNHPAGPGVQEIDLLRVNIQR